MQLDVKNWMINKIYFVAGLENWKQSYSKSIKYLLRGEGSKKK